MWPYVIFFVVSIFAIIYCDICKKIRYRKCLFYLLLIYSILLSGLRYRVGLDTLNYMLFYGDIPDLNTLSWEDFSNYSLQPFYLLLCALAKTISPEFYVFQFIHALIVNSIFFGFIKRYTSHPFWGIFLYFYIYYGYFNFEILKESLAISMFLLAFPYFVERKWLKYYLIVVLALMFHLSAVILFFIPLIRDLKFNRNYLLLLLLLGGFFAFVYYFTDFSSLLTFSEVVNEKIDAYQNNMGRFNWLWMATQLFPILILPLLLLWYCKYVNRELDLYENMLCFRIIIGIGAFFFQLVFLRFANYTSPFLLLILTDIIGRITQKCRANTFLVSAFCLLISLVYFLIPLMLPAARGRAYNQWVPYYSIFDPQKDAVRESMWENHFVY